MNNQMPKNISIEESSGTLTIIWRWFSFIHVFLLFFSLIWNFMTFGYYTGVFYSIYKNGEGFILGAAEIIALAFPVLHVIIGIALLYYAICGFINKTRISVTYENIEVTHRPLAWFGEKKVSVHDIRQIYCEKIRGRKGGVSYNVTVITNSFEKIKLLTGLLIAEQAAFIENTIEQRLGIADAPVEGEHKLPHNISGY